MEFAQVVSLAFVAIVSLVVLPRLFKKRIQLPPAPPAIPVLGHAHLIPPTGQDLFFYELGKTYGEKLPLLFEVMVIISMITGDVTHLKVLNKYLVVLNSVQAAVDLLEKRGNNYRDRPHLPIWEILGLGGIFSFLDAESENYRFQRKTFEQYFSKGRNKEYREIQIREARNLAKNLLVTPETDFNATLLQFSTALIIDLTYGHQVQANDAYMQIIDNCSRAAVESGPIGGTPVDLFPILRYFPSWFPGTYYATYARKASRYFDQLMEYPFEQVKKQMASGTVRPSYLAHQLEALRSEGEVDNTSRIKQIQLSAAAAYIAGAETTSSTLSFFLLAMVLYPECQLKAQEELDRVVGTDRLPEFADRENLPYLECVLQETARWNIAAPTGVPRKALEDDVYKGMLIPKGAMIITNFRAMTFDESIYKDAATFDPSRFLPPPLGRGEPPNSTFFGFGRRKCPGRYLAEDSLWIAIATILASVSIERAVGDDGKEIIPDAIPTSSGITSHAKPFPYRIKPRTKTVMGLLA
ncbi:hypothetical protein H0H92_001766 [Tricholoma furcatifolium]|nr:hypothetical protein H0H92_001766 [Tricholoma furcatifolium]